MNNRHDASFGNGVQRLSTSTKLAWGSRPWRVTPPRASTATPPPPESVCGLAERFGQLQQREHTYTLSFEAWFNAPAGASGVILGGAQRRDTRRRRTYWLGARRVFGNGRQASLLDVLAQRQSRSNSYHRGPPPTTTASGINCASPMPTAPKACISTVSSWASRQSPSSPMPVPTTISWELVTLLSLDRRQRRLAVLPGQARPAAIYPASPDVH